LLSRSLRRAFAQDSPDLERAKKLVSANCFPCHGADGESSSELYRKLAAQHPECVADIGRCRFISAA
jgi:cytochrome c553